nr:mitotic spindle checkpoint protein BUBR1-like isoform X1 [Setaria viridis]
MAPPLHSLGGRCGSSTMWINFLARIVFDEMPTREIKSWNIHSCQRQKIAHLFGSSPASSARSCIKWVQESFSTDGECSELVVLYEQCVRTFWHDERYKDDLRFLEVWLEYAGNCTDAEVIYKFLEANQIGQGHAIYYVSYVSLLEAKNKLRKANEIFDLGIARERVIGNKHGDGDAGYI